MTSACRGLPYIVFSVRWRHEGARLLPSRL